TWEVSSGSEVRTFTSRVSGVTHVSLSSDGHILASPGGCDTSIFASQNDDPTVKLWDLSDGRLSHTLSGHTSKPCFVAFSPDGRRLASRSRYDAMKLWDVSTGRELRALQPLAGSAGVA